MPYWRIQDRFNPTMVRLWPTPKRPKPSGKKIVSIPQWFDCGSSSSSVGSDSGLFQSHNGSIVAWRRGPELAQRLVGFNPTMVRLWPATGTRAAAARFSVSIPQWFDCGFHLLDHLGLIYNGFNPTMVRLWPKIFHPWSCALLLFQSHNGSIVAE